MSSSSETVQFSIGDAVLEGPVVDRELVAAYNRPPEDKLTVDVDGHRYSVLEGDADPI
jgi:hypothetical protein